MRATRRTLSATVLFLAAVVTACGSGEVRASAESGDRDEAQPSVQSSESVAEIVREAASVSSEFDTAKLNMVLEADGQQVMRSWGTVSSDNTRGDLTVSTPGGGFRMLFVDGAYYYQFPDMPDGVEWLSIPLDEVIAESGFDPTTVAMDPAATLDLLASLSNEDIEEIGTDTVFGETVTGYRGSISRDLLIEHGTASGTFSEGDVDDTASMLPEEFVMEVWIDDEGRPRRQEWWMEVTEHPGSMPVDFRIRVDFEQWGAPLDVTAPPPEITRPMDEFEPQGLPS